MKPKRGDRGIEGLSSKSFLCKEKMLILYRVAIKELSSFQDTTLEG